jgi:hypothetical protein
MSVDPTVQRAWLIHRICEEFHCLPREAAHELDEDPERLALLILDLRGYAAAKTAFDRAKDKVADLKAWEGSAAMTLVETLTFERRHAPLAEASTRG